MPFFLESLAAETSSSIIGVITTISGKSLTVDGVVHLDNALYDGRDTACFGHCFSIPVRHHVNSKRATYYTRTGDVVPQSPEAIEQCGRKNVVGIDDEWEKLIVHASVFDGGADVHAPLKVEKSLEDRREDARASGGTERTVKGAIRILDDERRGGREWALSRLGVII